MQSRREELDATCALLLFIYPAFSVYLLFARNIWILFLDQHAGIPSQIFAYLQMYWMQLLCYHLGCYWKLTQITDTQLLFLSVVKHVVSRWENTEDIIFFFNLWVCMLWYCCLQWDNLQKTCTFYIPRTLSNFSAYTFETWFLFYGVVPLFHFAFSQYRMNMIKGNNHQGQRMEELVMRHLKIAR